ncbi:MAG: zincin-like metallopeptidase domain-containing protein [Candidatus Bathyarchaeota archaeon]|nr:zincin-like metallopeptidase domain-containing protein [Candidatus Termiticorpusculum sp.]
MSVNVYELVTNRVLAELEKGVIPWRKPWSGCAPINYITRKKYRGINLFLLPHGGEYLTFKQCQECGGKIKKGEKSQIIVFFKMIEHKDEKTDEVKEYPYLKYSNVFHISQCEGVASKLEVAQEADPIETAQNIIEGYVSRSCVNFVHVTGSDRACYSPSLDKIVMPAMNQFESNSEYYSTAFHEMAHSTGHENRLNRISKLANFGTETYSKEELVAELSSAMLMNMAGIEQPATFENSVAYIQGWSKKLQEDKKAIVNAAGQAQKAVDYIRGEEC